MRLDATPLDKHFLDTSVAHKLLLGTTAYKNYLAAQFGNERSYISPYVQMEFRRTFLSNAISFYFVLDLPNIETVGDALALWSNKFKRSEHKAIEQFFAQLLESRKLNFKSPQDKPKALRAVGQLIKRLEMTFRRKFTNSSNDMTHCGRAAVPFTIKLESMTDDFHRFMNAFEDKPACRSKCRIDDVLLKRFRAEVEAYLRQAENLPQNKDSKGFHGVVANFKAVLEEGPSACTCNRCERYGDAVIALNAPRDMQLEHLDRSFEYLCPPIHQPHRLHPSETKIVKTAAAG